MKKEEVIQLKQGVFTLHKWHTYCSFESHKIHHETIETNEFKLKH